MIWAAKWRSKNKLDGIGDHIINEDCVPKLFRTRRLAREWIEQKYGYIRRRPDLLSEPHGWKIPIAVKVKVSEVKKEF